MFIKLKLVFLPSLQGTSLNFVKDILKEPKSHLKNNQVIHLEVPNYKELCIKNLNNDAIQDPLLSKYLGRRQLSNKLRERSFLFGVLATLRKQNMTDVIIDAHCKRFKAPDDDPKKETIAISMEELTKRQNYISSLQSLKKKSRTPERISRERISETGKGSIRTQSSQRKMIH